MLHIWKHCEEKSFMHLQIAWKVVTFFLSTSQELHYKASPGKWEIPWFDFVFSHTLSTEDKHIILPSNLMIF